MKFEKHSHLSSLLHEALQPVFVQIGVPPEQRTNYIESFARQISNGKSVNSTGRDSWTERVSKQQPLFPISRDIPDKAPALWREDKLKDDIPPEFIKRHYNKWLRNDGLGLILPDLQTLDQSLYDACINWKCYKNRNWPDDCPLPTKKEATELELQRIEEVLGDITSNDLTRISANLLNRERSR